MAFACIPDHLLPGCAQASRIEITEARAVDDDYNCSIDHRGVVCDWADRYIGGDFCVCNGGCGEFGCEMVLIFARFDYAQRPIELYYTFRLNPRLRSDLDSL